MATESCKKKWAIYKLLKFEHELDVDQKFGSVKIYPW